MHLFATKRLQKSLNLHEKTFFDNFFTLRIFWSVNYHILYVIIVSENDFFVYILRLGNYLKKGFISFKLIYLILFYLPPQVVVNFSEYKKTFVMNKKKVFKKFK